MFLGCKGVIRSAFFSVRGGLFWPFSVKLCDLQLVWCIFYLQVASACDVLAVFCADFHCIYLVHCSLSV